MNESSQGIPNSLTRFAIVALVIFALLGAARIGAHIKASSKVFAGESSAEIQKGIETCRQVFGLPPVTVEDEDPEASTGEEPVDSCERWVGLDWKIAEDSKPVTIALLGVSFLLSAGTFFIAIMILLRKRTAAIWAKRIFYGQLVVGVVETAFAVYQYVLLRDATELAFPEFIHSGFGITLHGTWLRAVSTYVVLAFIYKGIAAMVASPRMWRTKT